MTYHSTVVYGIVAVEINSDMPRKRTHRCNYHMYMYIYICKCNAFLHQRVIQEQYNDAHVDGKGVHCELKQFSQLSSFGIFKPEGFMVNVETEFFTAAASH